jgi:hypothetical protein
LNKPTKPEEIVKRLSSKRETKEFAQNSENLFLTVGIILQFDKELKKERLVLQVHILCCRLQNPVSTAPAMCTGIVCL